MQQYFRIAGSARYLPRERISAEMLDQKLGLRPGTTLARTGVQTRHRAAAPETALTMAKGVCEQTLAAAGCRAGDLDLLIDASLCVQQPIPCNAALIQKALGAAAAGVACLDVHASCLGFFAALRTVNGLFASGDARRILVVCAETPLAGVNWDEPESACLMGDGAAAFVFEAAPPTAPCRLAMETFAEGAHLCEVAGGGHALPPFEYRPEIEAKYRFHMDGRAVHKLASRLLPPLVERVLRETGCRLEELDVVPHQASGPAVELVARRLRINPERLHATLAEHGNLVSASLPFVLHGVRQQRPPGTRVLLLGTAAGYTQAAGVITL
jgi:3-oxoacyl-[acyl-carrier-protein] synthase III